jgi:hypothetical protein
MIVIWALRWLAAEGDGIAVLLGRSGQLDTAQRTPDKIRRLLVNPSLLVGGEVRQFLERAWVQLDQDVLKAHERTSPDREYVDRRGGLMQRMTKNAGIYDAPCDASVEWRQTLGLRPAVERTEVVWHPRLDRLRRYTATEVSSRLFDLLPPIV